VQVAVDAAVYRIQRREAANLLATMSLLFFRGATVTEFVLRTTSAALLNLFIYLFNDLCDVELDLKAPSKDRAKTTFLFEHRQAAKVALGVLFFVLFAMALFGGRILLYALFVNVGLDLLYSLWLKRVPLVDIVLTAMWGFSMTLCGVLERDIPHALLLAGYLGLVSACFEVIQVIRDEPSDRQAGLRTTGTVLGVKGATWLFRMLALGTGAYAVGGLGSVAGYALVLGVVLPLDPERASRSWDLARGLFGAVWLALLVGV